MLNIKKATAKDWDLIWPIFKGIVAGGDTYVYSPKITKAGAKPVWFDPKFKTFIARNKAGDVVGAYVIRPNHRDLGNHIANAAYVVDPKFRGRGFGRLLGKHSFVQAKKMGYKAMQFNYVISTNKIAVKLWQSLGFKIVGTVPAAHRHPKLGKMIDIYIMHMGL
jgi:L-amino acid N-acyltransferase YncA